MLPLEWELAWTLSTVSLSGPGAPGEQAMPMEGPTQLSSIPKGEVRQVPEVTQPARVPRGRKATSRLLTTCQHRQVGGGTSIAPRVFQIYFRLRLCKICHWRLAPGRDRGTQVSPAHMACARMKGIRNPGAGNDAACALSSDL